MGFSKISAFQKLAQHDLPNLWQKGTLPKRGGESRAPALLCGEKSFIRGRQQAHCGIFVCVVPGKERTALPQRRQQAPCRQRAGGAHAADCRKQSGRKGNDGESDCEPDKQE